MRAAAVCLHASLGPLASLSLLPFAGHGVLLHLCTSLVASWITKQLHETSATQKSASTLFPLCFKNTCILKDHLKHTYQWEVWVWAAGRWDQPAEGDWRTWCNYQGRFEPGEICMVHVFLGVITARKREPVKLRARLSLEHTTASWPCLKSIKNISNYHEDKVPNKQGQWEQTASQCFYVS